MLRMRNTVPSTAFTSPRIAETISNDASPSRSSMPGTSCAATNTATAVIAHLIRILKRFRSSSNDRRSLRSAHPVRDHRPATAPIANSRTRDPWSAPFVESRLHPGLGS